MTYKTFNIVYLKDFVNWSVLQNKEHEFSYSDQFPLVAIGKFLAPNQKGIAIQDDLEYKQITVRIKGGGVFLRTTKFGKDIGTKHQWIAKKGQFILSKIDARNGAMGIVPDELDGAIVTHDFPLFDVNTDIINPHFLLLIIITDSFMKFAQSCSSGTTNRQRIDVAKFLQQRIPLPSLKMQNALVESYNKTMDRAFSNELRQKKVEESIKSYIQSSLGLDNKILKRAYNKNKNKNIQFIRFSNISNRWDYEYFTQHNVIQSLYPLYTLKSLLLPILGPKTKIKKNDIKKKGEYPVITQEKSTIISGYTDNTACINDLPLVVFGDHSCSFKYIDFPFVRGADGTKLLKFNSKCNEYFYMELLSTLKIDNNDKYQRHYKYIENKLIPLPPLGVQQKIADYAYAKRESVKNLQKKVISLKEQAKKEFEHQIFNKK